MDGDPGPGREEPRRALLRGTESGGVLSELTAPRRRLELGDIEDLRAYERHREEFRARIIELKRRRRLSIGPIVTVVFENRDTMLFQVQEMARIEKMTTDEQVQGELDAYNPLIPEPGQLSATVFVELTNEAALREWLGKLVGIERALRLELGEPGVPGAEVEVVEAVADGAHQDQLTREDVTASVHYVSFELGPEQVDRLAAGPVALAICHPAYSERAVLSEEARAELLFDLRG